MRGPVSIAAALAMLPMFGGCYSYVQASAETVTPPAAVRAHLSSDGAAGIAEVLGESRSVLDGELTGVTPEGIFMLVPAASVRRGTRTEALSQELLIPRGGIVALQLRMLDRMRTAGLVAAAVGTVGVILYRTLSGDRGGDPSPPGGGGPTESAGPLAPFPRR